MARWAKCLLYRHEDLTLDNQDQVYVYNSIA